MKPTRRHLIILMAVALIYQNLGNVEGRTHFHKQKKKGSPVEAPTSQEAVSPSPVYPPPVPSDPSGPGDNSSSGCVFDVTSYGAVGDGSTDDTPAFRTAWKAACAVESAVLLVPSGYVFTITSTIFSGPCNRGLVFQVRTAAKFPHQYSSRLGVIVTAFSFLLEHIVLQLPFPLMGSNILY